MGPTAASTGRLVALVGVAQHLHHALLVELGDAPAELLELAGVAHPGDREVLGGEARDGGELDGLVDPERVADAHVGGVDQADDVAGVGLLDGLALLAEHLVGVLGGERLAGRAVGDDHAPLEAARAHPQERDAVAVRRVHVGLHLEHEAGERGVERRGLCRRRRRAALGDGTRSTTASSSLRTPKLVSAEPKNAGVDSAAEEQLDVEVGPDLVEQLDLVLALRPTPRPPRSAAALGVDDLLGRLGGAAGDAGEAGELPVAAVDDPAEVAGDADRPGDGRDDETDLLLDLVEQLERVAARAGPTC